MTDDRADPARRLTEGDRVAPRTGDDRIDAALDDLDEAGEDDLDLTLATGERVDEVLRRRLSDLGGD